MHQLHYLRANGPLFLGDKVSATDVCPVMLSRWARWMAARRPRSRPGTAKLLDTITALPSVRRAYRREGITDDIC
jgi:glutathione S-transferase